MHQIALNYNVIGNIFREGGIPGWSSSPHDVKSFVVNPVVGI